MAYPLHIMNETISSSSGKPSLRQTSLVAGLYIVATPIGNLGDITLRALETLHAADMIACEDTRVTGKLLNHYGVATPMRPYHEHNAAKLRPELLAAMQAGKAVALVSDAGTPLISDPGYKLVREAAALDIPVVPLPGASSVMAALVMAGLPTDRFCFAGFLPVKAGAAKQVLNDMAGWETTLVFFESPRRLGTTLPRMAEVLGAAREAVVAREITKLYEEARRGTLAELSAHYAAAEAPKGEAVIVIGPPIVVAHCGEQLDAVLRQLLATHSVRDAVAEACAQFDVPRSEVYARALVLKDAP